jgi:chromosome segregation ATPase
MAKAAPPLGGRTSHRGGLNTHLRNAWTRTASAAPRWLHTRTRPHSAFPDLDAAYQRQLEALTQVRRTVARVATSRKRLERQIGHLEQEARHPDNPAMETGQDPSADAGQVHHDAQQPLAGLRRQSAALETEERRITLASRRLQAKVETFRAAKETTENAYTAAEETAKDIWAEITSNAHPDAQGPASPTSQHN